MSRGVFQVYNGNCRVGTWLAPKLSRVNDQPEWGETVGHHEDRELVPLKSDFDVVWRGYRRSQVRFYIQQTETEMRILTEDRDSALSQVDDLSAELESARGEIEALRRQLDEVAKSPIDESALSDRLRRMVRLAHDEADEVLSSARATAEHEWARSEQAASELRERYQRLVTSADEWRQQWEQERDQARRQTREDIERMAREAEQHRRKLDAEAEQRRTQVEHDFEVSMSARRDEAMRVIAEREEVTREVAERRVREANEEADRRLREATTEAERRISLADQHTETLRRVREDVAERVRLAQAVLTDAEPLLSASAEGTEGREVEEYVASSVHNGHSRPWEEEPQVTVPKQREAEADEAAARSDETATAS
jgi:chromosome segregation ATPase